MRILLIETKITGHHLPYAQKLGEIEKCEIKYLISEKCDDIDKDQIIMKNQPNSFREYLLWLKEIKEVAINNNIDVIHFLYGDILYRFFGLGLYKLKKFKVLATFHQIRRSVLRDFSRKLIFNKIDCGIVHTNAIKELLNRLDIKNVKHIEYPQFSELPIKDKIEARKFFGIEGENIVIGAIGGTRTDKGLDLLLESLKYVDRKFNLLIAGKEQDFTENFIEEKTREYREKVTKYIKFLDDNELNLALNAVDIIVLPYRKCFDGASGPLAEGVWIRKTIIGPNHGSLGEIITSNCLGYTFESENVENLTKVIINSIDNRYEWTEKAEKYRDKLNVRTFKYEYENIYNNL